MAYFAAKTPKRLKVDVDSENVKQKNPRR